MKSETAISLINHAIDGNGNLLLILLATILLWWGSTFGREK